MRHELQSFASSYLQATKPGVTGLEPHTLRCRRLDSVLWSQRRRLKQEKAPTLQECCAANLSCRQSCIAAAVDLAQRRFKI